DPKAAARAVLDRERDALVALSHRIHATPETSFEEVQSSAWVADALEAGGFDVERGACDLPTAFVATAGDGPLTLAICAEYDALPGIGHACGHNIIAAAAVGAGLALAPVAAGLGLTVKVVGTPAEEGGGGKILMLDRGAFEGVNAAMMVHPAPMELPRMPCLAVAHVDVHYAGRAAHASAWPEMGINAADALTVAQTAIGLLRQHIRPTDRIHGIVIDGGDAPNIVPAHTVGKWYIRSRTLAELDELEPRVRACFEAGAVATGCGHEVIPQCPPYSEFDPDTGLMAAYQANAEALGRVFPDYPRDRVERASGSTDMANVSLAVPTIHPMLDIGAGPAVNHQPEFAAHCIRAEADRAVIDGAAAMAWTAIDAATDGPLRARLLSRQGPAARPPAPPARP
ncbi:MAG: M20 family metallopeptidase, partial [Acidimicrobiales bacterium]